jgi:hypothetical protein
MERATPSKEFEIPIQIEKLPSHIRMIVDDHLLNYPASDLIDLLTGQKSFRQALDSPNGEVQRAKENGGGSFETILDI